MCETLGPAEEGRKIANAARHFIGGGGLAPCHLVLHQIASHQIAPDHRAFRVKMHRTLRRMQQQANSGIKIVPNALNGEGPSPFEARARSR